MSAILTILGRATRDPEMQQGKNSGDRFCLCKICAAPPAGPESGCRCGGTMYRHQPDDTNFRDAEENQLLHVQNL